MGARRQVLLVAVGAVVLSVGFAGAGYGVYETWQQEQDALSVTSRTGSETDGESDTTRGSRQPPPSPEATTPAPKPSSSKDSKPEKTPSPSKPPEPDDSSKESPEPDPDPEPKPSPSKTSEDPKPSPVPTDEPSKVETFENEVVRLTNAEREDAGCEPLRVDNRLRTAARAHSTDMAKRDYFDHNSPDGTTPWERMKEAGYDSPSAENIAMGQATPQAAVDAWMNSSGHRANILNCSYHAIGVGVYLSDAPYWTQDFGFK